MIQRVLPMIVLFAACSTRREPELPAPSTPLPPGVQAVSLLGDTLRTFPLSAEARARYESQLAEAKVA